MTDGQTTGLLELLRAAKNVKKKMHYFSTFKKSRKGLIAKLKIEPNQNKLLKNLEGTIFTWLFVRHGDVTVVRVAFEDAQVIKTLMDVEYCIMDD